MMIPMSRTSASSKNISYIYIILFISSSMFKREVWFACTVVLCLFLIGFGFVYAEEAASEEQSAIGAPIEDDALSESDLIEEKVAEETASEAEDKGAVLEA